VKANALVETEKRGPVRGLTVGAAVHRVYGLNALLMAADEPDNEWIADDGYAGLIVRPSVYQGVYDGPRLVGVTRDYDILDYVTRIVR
jgi:hypothetical protein